MRKAALLFRLALPLAIQSHLNVAPGQVRENRLRACLRRRRERLLLHAPVQQRRIGEHSVQHPGGPGLRDDRRFHGGHRSFGYIGSLDGNASLHWYANGQQNLAMLYPESFRALGANETCGFSRSLTAGHVFVSSATSKPSFYVNTPWDTAHGSLRITTSGYLINYP